MPITIEEALLATDPSLPEDQRQASAQRIVDGVRANEVYWDHRSKLEALEAQATGHGTIARGADEGGEPVAVEPAPQGAAATAPAAEPAAQLPPSPDNSTEAVAKLRAQVESLGATPEA